MNLRLTSMFLGLAVALTLVSEGVLTQAAADELPKDRGTLREFALAQDRRPIDDHEQELIEVACRIPAPAPWLVKRCEQGRARKGRLSDRADFLSLLAFERPEVLVQTSSREFLVEAFAQAVLDPSFACERPGLYEFLRQEFQLPHRAECPASMANSRGQPSESGRVYRVDLAVASPGRGLIERWGHVMFRVVVCAPFRETTGPDCLKDTAHHLIYTFNGDGRDESGVLAGLTGEIPARLLRLSMKSVRSYYLDRGRKVAAYALRLSAGEQARLLALLAELEVSYRGRWNDLANNCVSHTLRALTASLEPGRLGLEPEPATPQDLADLLVRVGIANPPEPMRFLAR